MNRRHNPRRHEHYQNVPVPFVQSLNAHNSSPNTCQKRPKPVIFISEPSHPALNQPQSEGGGTKKQYNGEGLLVKWVVKVLFAFEKSLAAFDELENRTDD